MVTFDKDTITRILEFYKTNSTTITCEKFNITWDRLKKILQKHGVEKHDAKTNRELTNIYRFGVSNPGLLVESHEKAKKTTEARYGVANYRNPEKAMQTRIDNCGSVEASYQKGMQTTRNNNQERYGVDYYFQTPEFLEKAISTNNERYGVDNFRQSDEYDVRYRETCLNKYGVEHYSQTDEYKAQIIKTCNEKFGADSWFGSELGKASVIKTNIEKFGAPNVMQTDFGKQAFIQSLQETHGVDNPMQSVEIRSKQARSARESSLEIQVSKYLIEKGITHTKHHVVKVDSLIHEFDFAILNPDGNLKLLLDCDGVYYHAYLDDVNGKSVNPVADNYRMLLVPEGVDFIVVSENDFLSKLDAYFNSETYSDIIFEWCRMTEFPYPVVNNPEASYKSLCKGTLDKFSIYSRLGQRVIDKFHKSIWKANKKGFKSPYEAWIDDTLLRRCIDNRLVYIGNEIEPSKVLYGLSAARIAPKVSVFNPYLAKYLVEKYLSEFNTVFDPCSGYSGRLLGTCSTGKRYIGQDINSVTVKESNDIIDCLKLDAQVTCVNSLTLEGTYDCLFTCSPYSDKERWGMDIPNMTCDEWIDAIRSHYKCSRYLFVVDTTDKYKNNIVEELVTKSHLTNNKELVLLFS